MAIKKKKASTSKKKSLEKKGLTDQEITQMLSGVNQMTKNLLKRHIEGVRVSTGEILVEDVDYCLRLGDRILAYSKSTQKDTLQEALKSI